MSTKTEKTIDYIIQGPQIQQLTTDDNIVDVLTTCNPKWHIRISQYILDTNQHPTEPIPILIFSGTIQEALTKVFGK